MFKRVLCPLNVQISNACKSAKSLESNVYMSTKRSDIQCLYVH